MILTLIREQVRSQARYAGAAFALVAVATSLAAFVLISLATAQREGERLYSTFVGDTENHAWLAVWTRGATPDVPKGMTVATLTEDQLDSIVAELSANGSTPELRRDASVWMEGDSYAHHTASLDYLPPSALAEGTAPGAGQVVVDAALAESRGLAVGDSVGFSPDAGLPATMTLDVSGILRGSSSYAGDGTPRVVVSNGEGRRLFEQAGFMSRATPSGERTALITVMLSWNGEIPQSLSSAAAEQTWGNDSFTGVRESYAVTALVLVLITALIAAAAAGRSQGAARTQWVGTVRALGATRRHVVTAAMLETVIVGVVAGVVGVAMGAGVNIAVIRLQGGTFAGYWPSLTASAVALSIGLALAVSLILGATPAYWAARTTPAAALSPVGPADAVPWRPRIGTRTLLLVAGGAAALLLARTRANEISSGWPVAVVLVLAAVFAVTLYLLTSRALERVVVALGNSLIHRGQRVLVAAGSGLVQHPRNAASIATAIAVGGIGAGAIVWWLFMHPQGNGTQVVAPSPWPELIETAGLTTLLTAIMLGTAAVVVNIAIWIGRGRVAGDAAIYGALGLSRRDRQVAAMLQVAIASLAGGAGGMVLGTVGAAVANGVLLITGTWEVPSIASPVEVIAQGVVVWLGALLGVAAVSATTSLAAARASDGKDPASLRRSASRGGATF